jgi:hypothetical protein
MKTTLVALTLLGGVVTNASAMPVPQEHVTAITPVDWYCGPHCQQRHWYWRNHTPYHSYYGYRPYRPYYPRYGYYGY